MDFLHSPSLHFHMSFPHLFVDSAVLTHHILIHNLDQMGLFYASTNGVGTKGVGRRAISDYQVVLFIACERIDRSIFLRG